MYFVVLHTLCLDQFYCCTLHFSPVSVHTWTVRHENSRRHGRHAWGTTLIELRNHIRFLSHNCRFCLIFVWLEVRIIILGCLQNISSCIYLQFEAETMILPHLFNLNAENSDQIILQTPISMRNFEEPTISRIFAWGTNRHNSHVWTSYDFLSRCSHALPRHFCRSKYFPLGGQLFSLAKAEH